MPNVTYEYKLNNSEVKYETVTGNIPIGPKEYDKLKFIKISSSSNVLVGDVFEYTFLIINEYSISVENIIISDDLNENLKFINGSIKIDNKIKSNEDITKGIILGRLNTNELKQVSYKVQLISEPKENELITCGKCYYNIKEAEEKMIIESNSVYINIGYTDVDINITSNSKIISFNNKVKINVNIKNTGKLMLKNIKLFLQTPKYSIIDINSININEKKIYTCNIKEGIVLEDLSLSKNHNIEYKIKLINQDYSDLIQNIYISYNVDNTCEEIVSNIFNYKLDIEKIVCSKLYIDDEVYINTNRKNIEIENINTKIDIFNYELYYCNRTYNAMINGNLYYKIIYCNIDNNELLCIEKIYRINKKVGVPIDYKYRYTKIIDIDTSNVKYIFYKKENKLKIKGIINIYWGFN